MEVHCLAQIELLQKQVRDQALLSREKLYTLSPDPLDALHTLKFEKFGYHPLDGHPLNFVEQLNQTFTILASLSAAKLLIGWFPKCGGLRLNPGAKSGRDIESIFPKAVEAEVFAAVHPKNNRKLKADMERLAKSNAANRYVFFYAPSFKHGRRKDLEQSDSEIRVWALDRQEIM